MSWADRRMYLEQAVATAAGHAYFDEMEDPSQPASLDKLSLSGVRVRRVAPRKEA